jgi:LPXTG-motif cell wall-anchored protein
MAAGLSSPLIFETKKSSRMKKFLFVLTVVFAQVTGFAQSDTSGPIEPGMETSFDNTELLIVALVGLALLLLLYFFFRRRRK